jgi:hypothetical protein
MEHAGVQWTMLNGQFANADAICLQETSTRAFNGLQEARDPSGVMVAKGTFQLSTRSRGRSMHLAVARFRQGMNSVGVMVSGAGVMASGAARPIHVIPSPDPVPNSRATIGMQHDTGVWIYSIHAPSMRGVRPQLDWINNVLAAIAVHAGVAQWICAGDYNALPEKVTQLIPAGTAVVYPGGTTQQSGRELDFAVCTDGAISTAAALDGCGGDHLPVRLT